MPAAGFRTGVAAGRDAMREHRAGSPRREPVGATGQGPNVASASEALPSVLLPDAPEKRTAGLTARPGVGARWPSNETWQTTQCVSSRPAPRARSMMARTHPGQYFGGFLDCLMKHFPHRWHRVANCIQSPSANHKALERFRIGIRALPLVTIQDGTSESVQFRHRVALQTSLQHDAVFVQHVADGAFRTLQAKHQIAVCAAVQAPAEMQVTAAALGDHEAGIGRDHASALSAPVQSTRPSPAPRIRRPPGDAPLAATALSSPRSIAFSPTTRIIFLLQPNVPMSCLVLPVQPARMPIRNERPAARLAVARTTPRSRHAPAQSRGKLRNAFAPS